MATIIIVMMIRMLMMGAIIAGRDCMVLPPCLVLYNACVANIGLGFFYECYDDGNGDQGGITCEAMTRCQI